MPRKSTSAYAEGTRVRVKPGVEVPDMAGQSIAGWTGTIVEVGRKKAEPTFVIEWDDSTTQAMPAEYLSRCEADGLYYKMVCLSAADVEPCP
jgi:hypothetical protein